MADISVHRSHNLGLEEAQGKIDQIVADIREDFGNLVSSIKWNNEKTVAQVMGKGFTGEFRVSESEVGVDVKLKIFARPLKGKVQSKIEERMNKYFG